MSVRNGAFVLTVVLLGATVPFLGCGDDATQSLGGPIITVTNAWVEEGNTDHLFVLNSENDGEDEGVFQGEESLPDLSTNQVSGSWERGSIRFTTDAEPSVVWTAAFGTDNPTRLVFTAGGQTLVLLQGGGG